MADLSAQNSELRQRMQHLEERLTSTTTTSPAESMLQVESIKFKKAMEQCQGKKKGGVTKTYFVMVADNDKKSLCYGEEKYFSSRKLLSGKKKRGAKPKKKGAIPKNKKTKKSTRARTRRRRL